MKPVVTPAQSKPGFHTFNLPDGVIAPPTRALLKVQVVQFFLEVNRAGVMQRIEDGRLAWAFCISPPNTYRRELRILAACMFEQMGLKTGLPKPTADLTFAEVVELILPHHRPDLRGIELQRTLNCQADTIRQITRRRGWLISTRARVRYGPNSSHKYSRASVIRFLEQSRVT